MTIATRIRDWWRGYTDADAQSWGLKYAGPLYPGRIICLTAGELRAKIAWDKAGAEMARRRHDTAIVQYFHHTEVAHWPLDAYHRGIAFPANHPVYAPAPDAPTGPSATDRIAFEVLTGRKPA